MYGSDILYNALNVPAVTDALDTFDGVKTLYDDITLPDDLPIDFTSINFYTAVGFNAADPTTIYNFTANCRHSSHQKSRILAQIVTNVLNRKGSDNYFFTCTVLPTIPPADNTDNYNTPIEVIIKTR